MEVIGIEELRLGPQLELNWIVGPIWEIEFTGPIGEIEFKFHLEAAP